jgi:hypothetical protein
VSEGKFIIGSDTAANCWLCDRERGELCHVHDPEFIEMRKRRERERRERRERAELEGWVRDELEEES